ncbi:myosin-binding protein 3-like isoform X1 [Senna tora]|uniref:Myosin-binding protein 3-like isoform X1 n=1 Tax=Senna tora TaxID=362788 RepID=A0A834TPM7_9FABA|nr:myosin-binding protein 3-like isoform X1 [Senna tora]
MDRGGVWFYSLSCCSLSDFAIWVGQKFVFCFVGPVTPVCTALSALVNGQLLLEIVCEVLWVSELFREGWLFGKFILGLWEGVLGYKNGDLCLHKMLFDWPLRKICSIQVMAVKRFPYDLVKVKDHSCTLNEKITAEKKPENGVLDLEDDASCSSCSSPHLLTPVDRENGYDAKGKGVMKLKRRSGVRRRRKCHHECGKFSPVFHSENPQLDIALVSSLPYESDIAGGKTIEMANPASEKEVSLLDVEDAQTTHDMDEGVCHSYECGSLVESPQQDKYSSSTEIDVSNRKDEMQKVGSEENHIEMLEAALEEEKAAYASLCLELEKERAAAATAADEAMAMISRLQEEKASIEIETRQYQRMIEERVAYEEEEMNILQEILIRREKENHFLEKELEAYRQMSLSGSEQSNGKPNIQLDQLRQRPSFSLETNEDQLQTDSSISIVKKAEIKNLHSNMVDQTCTRIDDGEELKRNRELKNHFEGKLHNSFLDTESNVLDVHVIDDKIELRKKENEKIICSSLNTASGEPRYGDLALRNLEAPSSITVSNLPRTSKPESRNVFNANINEKLRIGTEIEMLAERLKMLKHEKEKLTIFAGNEESNNLQLKLLEEIANQLQEIKQLRNPLRGSSLPPSSAKVSLRKRRSQSTTWKTCESS